MTQRSKKLLRLKVERTARGWSQTETFRRTDIPTQTISALENGRLRPHPTAGTVQRLARLFNVSPEELLKPVRVPAKQ